MDKIERLQQQLLLNAQLNALLKAKVEIDDVFYQQKKEIRRQIKALEVSGE